MNAGATRYLDLLEQRIGLLGSLADALVSAGASISAFDIDGLRLASSAAATLRGNQRADSRIDAVQRTVPSRYVAARQRHPLNRPDGRFGFAP